MTAAITVDTLSKRYRVGQAERRHDTFSGALTGWVTSPFANYRRLRRLTRFDNADTDDVLWALRAVSFEVQSGEVVGVIGRNGAGKSILLKILSRITEPTAGRIVLQGRVSSLLEVGTGFHPELTGRENIFLNGTILGMSKREVGRKFDEIVDFSGVERFLETPVKRYSSGMKVRLAFSVAAHLEPEILLIDEVLAVGDAAFQRKCIGKLEDVAHGGRTVIFVSHDLSAVEALCTRALLLEGGQVRFDGAVADTLSLYVRGSQRQSGRADLTSIPDRRGSGVARFSSAQITNADNDVLSAVPMGADLMLDLEFECQAQILDPSIAVRLHTPMAYDICAWRTEETYGDLPVASTGGKVRLTVPRLTLLPGSYCISLALRSGNQLLDYVEDVLQLEVIPRDVYHTGKLPASKRGIMYTPCVWQHDYT